MTARRSRIAAECWNIGEPASRECDKLGAFRKEP